MRQSQLFFFWLGRAQYIGKPLKGRVKLRELKFRGWSEGWGCFRCTEEQSQLQRNQISSGELYSGKSWGRGWKEQGLWCVPGCHIYTLHSGAYNRDWKFGEYRRQRRSARGSPLGLSMSDPQLGMVIVKLWRKRSCSAHGIYKRAFISSQLFGRGVPSWLQHPVSDPCV